MIKEEFVAKKGLENVFNSVVSTKEAFETDYENAKTKALEDVEKEFAERKKDIEDLFSQVAVLVQVEVPDEEKQEFEETELKNETIYVG